LLPEALRQDIQCPSRARRLRAIEMARVSGAVVPLERELIDSLDDEDHFIRSAAAAALGQCNTFASRMALRSALSDRSVGVRQAARDSLDFLLAGSELRGAALTAEAETVGDLDRA
jgi:HEAT repeat protein